MIAKRKSMILPILAVMLIIYLQTAQGVSYSSEEDSSESSSSSTSSSDSESSSSETEESSESSSITEESNENRKQFFRRFVPERFRRQPYPSEKLEEFPFELQPSQNEPHNGGYNIVGEMHDLNPLGSLVSVQDHDLNVN
ncbi:uncharacterized protein LOC122501526 [Leptopilina heterotoma]|uniref:uncharacterized protein LOC122501526 n=1 Tax=Leptopilina heterotoma TaxID=63436 RepID=UPI001CA9C04C|nr:uncharacterized protein LOC122501526 [Leptopilina heterotoma]